MPNNPEDVAPNRPKMTLEDLRGKTPEDLYEIVTLVDAHLKDLHQNERGELRELDEAEQSAFDTLLQVRDKAMLMLDEHRKVQEVFKRKPKSVEVGFNSLGGMRDEDPYSDVRRLTIAEARDRALRSLDSRHNTAHLASDQKDHVEKQIRSDTDIARRILVTENEEYRSAWKKLVTNPHPILNPEEQRAVLAYEEYRALSEGVTTAGGFGIPVKLAA